MSSSTQPAPVSVIVPCFRCADTIDRALASVAAQTRPPAEVVLVEDASDDAGVTTQAIERAAATLRSVCPVVVLQQAHNAGPAAARNRAWDSATQPYLAFLDADDAWHPRKLEYHTAWMLAHPEVTLSGHASRIVGPDEPLDRPEMPSGGSRVAARSMLWSNPFSTRSVMVKRELPLRFPPHMRRAEDYSLWLSIVFAGHAAYRLPSVLAYSFKPSFGAGGLTRDLWSMERGELAAYAMLRQAGHIDPVTALAARTWSLIRFVRRVVLTHLHRT